MLNFFRSFSGLFRNPFVKKNNKSLLKGKTAIYAGSFDPPHYGHLDTIYRATEICDKLIVCVAFNPEKKDILLSPQKRVEILKALTHNFKHIEIIAYDGLLARYAIDNDVNFFVRGMRNMKDFEQEYIYYPANYELCQKDTVCLLCKPEFRHINSSLIREILKFKGSIVHLVPQETIKHLS